MASCLADVRTRTHVEEVAADAINDNNRLLERGCRALGLSSKRFALNMRDCLGCGFCAEGCAYDRKQGTLVTYGRTPSREACVDPPLRIDRLDFERRAGGSRQSAPTRG